MEPKVYLSKYKRENGEEFVTVGIKNEKYGIIATLTAREFFSMVENLRMRPAIPLPNPISELNDA